MTLEEALAPVKFFARITFLCPWTSRRNAPINIVPAMALIGLWLALVYMLVFYFFIWESIIVTVITYMNFAMGVFMVTTAWIRTYLHPCGFYNLLAQFARIDASLLPPPAIFTITRRSALASLCFAFVMMLSNAIEVAITMLLIMPGRVPLVFAPLYMGGLTITYFLFTVHVAMVHSAEMRFALLAKRLQHVYDACRENANNPKWKRVLRAYCEMHLQLAEAVRAINETFGVSVFAMIAMYFLLLVCNAYMIGLTAKCMTSTLAGCIAIGLTVMHSLPAFTVIGAMCLYGQRTRKNAEKSGWVVHDFCAIDKQLMDDLRSFSMQILHSDVRITAGDFFDIDLRLIFACIGVITTYLIILIQFTDDTVCNFAKHIVGFESK